MFEKHPYAEPFTKESFQKYFDNCLVVFDSSVLLNLYDLTTHTREQFLNVLKHPKVNSKLWLPSTVVEEYLKNREVVILRSAQRIRKSYDDIFGSKGIFNSYLPEISGSDTKTNSISNLLLQEVNSKEQLRVEDTILDQLNVLFPSAKTGDPIENDLETKWSEEFKDRLQKGIHTPGSMDQNKKYNKSADFFIWKSLMSTAEKEGKNICFVTRDKKEDWWSKHSEESVTEKVVLLKEFYDKTRQRLKIFDDIMFVEILLNYQQLEQTEEKLVIGLKKENQLSDTYDLTFKFNEFLRNITPAFPSNFNEVLKNTTPQFLPNIAAILNSSIERNPSIARSFQPLGGLLGATQEFQEIAQRHSNTTEIANEAMKNLEKLKETAAKSTGMITKASDTAENLDQMSKGPDLP